MPGWVGGEDDRDRPEALFWLSDDGAVLGHLLDERGALLHKAAASLADTIKRPLVGKAHAPARVRVASRELAQVLRAAHGGIEIVCAPTPELAVPGSPQASRLRRAWKLVTLVRPSEALNPSL